MQMPSHLGLIAYAALYVLSSTAEVATIKGLNYVSDVHLACYSALCLNALWLLLLPSYVRARWRGTAAAARAAAAAADSDSGGGGDSDHTSALVPAAAKAPPPPVTVAAPLRPAVSRARAPLPTTSVQPPQQPATELHAAPEPPAPEPPAPVPHDAAGAPTAPPPDPPPPSAARLAAAYALFTAVTFGITLLRNVGANALPGGVFSVLVSTSIAFNLGLSRLVLGRRLTRWHGAAAALCLAAAATLGLSAGGGGDHGGGDSARDRQHHYGVGVPATLGAAACIALSSVLNDHVTRGLGPGDDAQFRITEMTLVASVGASALLLPVLFASGEARSWRPQLGTAWAAGGAARWALLALSLAMPCVKAGSRLGKYHVVARSSALAFEFVQAAGSLVGALANAGLFGERLSPAFLGAVGLLAGAFACYARGRLLLKRAHAAEHVVRGVRHHQHSQQLLMMTSVPSEDEEGGGRRAAEGLRVPFTLQLER